MGPQASTLSFWKDGKKIAFPGPISRNAVPKNSPSFSAALGHRRFRRKSCQAAKET
jgi:hypothetical protein